MPKKSEQSWCLDPKGLVSVSLFALLFLLLGSSKSSAAGQSVSLAWDANSETDVIGYIVYMGTVSGSYPITNYVGQATSATVSGLQPGGIYYFVVTAYTASGLESTPSEEIVYQAPGLAPKPQISMAGGTISVKFPAISGKTYVVEYKNSLTDAEWTPLASIAGSDGLMTVTDATSSEAPARFYRVGVE